LINQTNSQIGISQSQITPDNLLEEELIEELIRKEILSLRDKVVNNCEVILQKRLSFPNQEALSKFDRFATAGFKGQKSETAWRIFYQDDNNQALIWSGAKQKKENEIVEQEWQRLVDSVIQLNHKEVLLMQV
jgi:hypothetical protein